MKRRRVDWDGPAYVDCGTNATSGMAEYVVYRRTRDGERRQLAVFVRLASAVMFAAAENDTGAGEVNVEGSTNGAPEVAERRITVTEMAERAYRAAVAAGLQPELMAGGYRPEGIR